MTEGEEGESGLLLLVRPSSLWELVETEGLAEESTEEELLCFPDLILDEVELPRTSAEPFPFDIPFCFVVCTKPLCFLEVFPSFLVSNAVEGWVHGEEGVVEVVQSVLGEQDLCPAGTGWPFTLGSFSFFTFSDEFTSVLSARLTGTCLADFVPWLAMAGTEAGVEAVVNVDDNDRDCDDDEDDDGNDNDDDDDASGGEAADAVCLDVVWTASKPER